jgi:hypothetical protein
MKKAKRSPAQDAAFRRNAAYGMICMIRGSADHILTNLYGSLRPEESARLSAIGIHATSMIKAWKEK